MAIVETLSKIEESEEKSHPSPKQTKGKIDSNSMVALNPITFFPRRSMAFPLACLLFPSFCRRSLVP